jgi:hypothetical protein
VLSASFFIAQVNESVSAMFQARLYEACIKVEKTTDFSSCKCYSSQVTKRYNDVQLISIYKLLKIPDANRMFIVSHSPEGIACRSKVSK